MILDATTLVYAVAGHEIVAERVLWSAPRLLLSSAVADELGRLLARPFISRYLDPAQVFRVLGALRAYATWFEPQMDVTDCLAPANNRTLELAAATGSSIVVSMDDELLALHHWQGIRILRPSRALSEL